jgi:hypothetical protein
LDSSKEGLCRKSLFTPSFQLSNCMQRDELRNVVLYLNLGLKSVYNWPAKIKLKNLPDLYAAVSIE